MKKMKKYDMGGAVLGEGLGSQRKPLPSEMIEEEDKAPRGNLIDRAKKAARGVSDEYMRGVKRIGQDLGIAKDENEYEDRARLRSIRNAVVEEQMKNAMKGYKKGGKVSSASSRADGCAQRGKTKGRMV